MKEKPTGQKHTSRILDNTTRRTHLPRFLKQNTWSHSQDKRKKVNRPQMPETEKHKEKKFEIQVKHTQHTLKYKVDDKIEIYSS